jgi:HSP20 family molecular chaperone IbpA
MEVGTRSNNDDGASTPNYAPVRSSFDSVHSKNDHLAWDHFWDRSLYQYSHTNLWEDAENIYLKLPTRGVKDEDLDINITGSSVAVSGRTAYERENGHALPPKRSEASVSYEVSLPKMVHPNLAKASYEDGTLLLTLPKMMEM